MVPDKVSKKLAAHLGEASGREEHQVSASPAVSACDPSNADGSTGYHSIISSLENPPQTSCRPNVDIQFPLSKTSPADSVDATSTVDRSANKSDVASFLRQVPKNSRQTRVPDKIRLSSTPISPYPIPHPPIHRPATAEGKEFTPIPWQRCVVESMSPPAVLGISKQGRQRPLNNQMSRIMECRVVDSAQAAIANERAPGADCPSRKIRCVLKGEWAGIVLETGKFRIDKLFSHRVVVLKLTNFCDCVKCYRRFCQHHLA